MNNSLTKVVVQGVPRSGTSWIGEILNSSPHTVYRYQPLFSYILRDFLTNASTRENIDDFFQELLQVDDAFINQTENRQSGNFPRFDKGEVTHVVFKEVRYINILFNLMRQTEDVHLCAVIRNPLSVINSWLRAPREFRSDLGWNELEEWRYALKKNLNRPEEFNGYEKWKEAASIFLQLKKQYPDRVHIHKYADFLARPAEEATILYKSLSLPMTESTTEFLSQSSTRMDKDPYSVFRALQTDNKWKTQLNPMISDLIQADLNGTALQEYIDA